MSDKGIRTVKMTVYGREVNLRTLYIVDHNNVYFKIEPEDLVKLTLDETEGKNLDESGKVKFHHHYLDHH